MRVAIILTASFATLSARDLVPEHWIENVPATNDSIQTSLVFRSVAGVAYRVETSDNLVDWDTDGEFYGLGHDIASPMREFTPAPPPDPGAPPPAPPPTKGVSLVLQSSSESEGGTIVSWKSLDEGGPKTFLLEENLHEDWDSMPLYFRSFGDYRFFIFRRRANGVPPSEEPSLGMQDSAMIEELESSFAAMNLEVANAVAASRNAPPPAPPVPGARKFWRIYANWSVDTDGDGSPDWAEFEILKDPNHPSYALSNPFMGDNDGDGFPDGQQLDADKDGAPDAIDIAVGDALVNQQKTPLPRYALFPIENLPAGSNGAPPTPLQINDRGTVLYEKGVWQNGEWQQLTLTGNSLTNCRAAGINDAGEIVGVGGLALPHNLGNFQMAVRWADENSAPDVITVGSGDDLTYATPTYAMSVNKIAPGPAISNDGHIIAYTAKIENEDTGRKLKYSDHPSLWTLPGMGRTAAHSPVAQGIHHVQNANTYWGPKPNSNKTTVVISGTTHELDFTPLNIVQPAGGLPHALSIGSYPNILENGNWKVPLGMLSGIDTSNDGTAISIKTGETVGNLRLNGHWLPLSRAIPDATNWRSGNVKNFDTTQGGWILANRIDEETPTYATLLPLRVEGNLSVDGAVLNEGVGVDSFSIGSTNPGTAVQDKIWIMAPLGGGETKVKVTAPIHPSSPITLSGTGLKFDGNDSITLQNAVTEFSLKAEGEIASGTEIPITIKLGSGNPPIQSLSNPIMAKVMKRRVVKIRLWIVKSDSGQLPTFNPTETVLEDYLNKIFKSQINATFDIITNDSSIGPVGYDSATGTTFGAPPAHNAVVSTENGVLDFTTDFKGEMWPIRVRPNNQGLNYVSTVNINMYIVGGASWIAAHKWDTEKGKLITLKAGGIANINDENAPREIWLPGETTELQEGLLNAAHEVGHYLFGEGHPQPSSTTSGSENSLGPAPLPGTPKPPRLMCNDPELGKIGGLRRLTVKGEWDEAKKWFDKEINANRMEN